MLARAPHRANFMGIEPWYTEQGVAGLPQVNFVGPYTLTRRLVGCMESTAAAGASTSAATAGASAAGTAEAKATGRARIVNLCSVMHRFSSLPEDPQFFLKVRRRGLAAQPEATPHLKCGVLHCTVIVNRLLMTTYATASSCIPHHDDSCGSC